MKKYLTPFIFLCCSVFPMEEEEVSKRAMKEIIKSYKIILKINKTSDKIIEELKKQNQDILEYIRIHHQK